MTEENNNTVNTQETLSVNLEVPFAENQHKNLRAFFVSFASSKEEAQAVAEGKVDVGTWLEYFGLNADTIAERLKRNEEIKKRSRKDLKKMLSYG